MSKNKNSVKSHVKKYKRSTMKLEPATLFGKRDTIEEASEYFDSVIKALPKKVQFHAFTAFAVFWNTLAYKYDLKEKSYGDKIELEEKS